MQLRRPGSAASSGLPAPPLWTQLGSSPSSSSRSSSSSSPLSPAARSGHAMTLLPPTNSVLLFGGADGKVFFDDVFILEPASYASSNSTRSSCAATRSRREGDIQDTSQDVQWKRLVVSRGSTFSSQSPRSPLYASTSNTGHGASPTAGGSGSVPTFLHPGGGRDYHSMHYVLSPEEEERARGMRVLVVGNVVVASDEAARGTGTQAEAGAANAAMAFDALTLRVEELRVRQPLLEAQWEPRRVDSASMWKPRARHAHSSVVVGGEQVFVFGGKDATSATFFNDIFYYDAPLNQWVKPTVDPTGQLPQPRAFAGLTASEDGNTLFLFGGTDGKQEFGSLFLYDVAHCRWDSLAGATLGDRPSCRINHSLTFVAPNHLVLFGGRRRAMRQNELFIYNVNTRAWRLVHAGQRDDGVRSSRRRSSQTTSDDKVPAGRTAHATVLFHSEPSGPNAVQKLLVFGGYAGSHQWLDDLYLLSLPQAVLMQPPTVGRSSPRLTAASQRTRPLRGSSSNVEAAARVALSAPQQPIQMCQSPQPTRLPQVPSQSLSLLQQSASRSGEPPQSSQLTQPLQEPPPQPVEPETRPAQVNPEQLPPMPQNSRTPAVVTANSPSRNPQPRESSRVDAIQRATATTAITTGSGVLTDITNQSTASSQKQQQQPVAPRPAGVATTDAASSGSLKKHKRRRLVEDSQDSSNSNSNSSNGSVELTTAQVGIQTMLLQLLQHQPRVEDTLARVLSMLTREQTARQQQSMNQDTLMRVHSEEQSKRIEAATRRNEALEGRLARCETERAALHEKLMARETELYLHKHSLEAAIPPLNARVEAIESSHMQQLDVSRVIEAKISAVHDFMDELRNAGGEGTEADDSPQRQLGRMNDSVATQPTPSPPKPLLYPQRVVLALEEKVRVMQSEKEALEVQVKEMSEKLTRVEGREAQARQFLFSWCQGDNPPVPGPAANAPTAELTQSESANPGTDKMTNSEKML